MNTESRPRPPWWMYLVAASFLAFLSLFAYVVFWGPQSMGITMDYSEGAIRIATVRQDSPAMRAGLQAGDFIVAVDGQVIAGRYDFAAARQNLEVGRPHRLQVRRRSASLETTVTLGRLQFVGSADDLLDVVIVGSFFLMLFLALLIAYQRPQDMVARVAALYLACTAIFGGFIIPPGFAALWRQLPVLLGGLLWIARAAAPLIGPVTFTFVSIFPQKFPLPRWVRVSAWFPAVLLAPCILYYQFRAVYQPGLIVSPWMARALGMEGFLLAFHGLAGFVVFTLNYRRLEDPNQKRRVRVLLLGGMVGLLPGFPWVVSMAVGPINALTRFFLSGSYLFVGSCLFAIYPITFAYVVLRHRFFDVRVMIRQGVQYALARHLVVSLVPLFGAILVLDLVLHGDQPLLAIIRQRGWIYLALGALALTAHFQRQSWMDALDRRFFRERYDAQRLLRDVAEQVRAARSFEAVGPLVVARIEEALHPEFAALLRREPGDTHFRCQAAAPAGQAPPPLLAESKLVGLVRLLGKPLEVPHSESGWLQQQLPHDETDFLRRARMDLILPIFSPAARSEILLVLGVKRSEEPYSREDQDLLLAIASSLAILLEKPAAAAPAPLSLEDSAFEECSQCGAVFDSGTGRSSLEGALLSRTLLTRTLAGRYHLEKRLGRGGMGTVYAATDTALERRVAVKVIRDDLIGSADAADRFRREAKAAASFAHPNVVTVHDFGVAADTRAFLVMELLMGSSLREELQREKRLAPARVLDILRGACAAVDAAHRRNLIHRDLKPENIFLARTESGELPKVLDFGVAKFLPAESQATQATRDADTGAGQLVGTFRYMSPEQLSAQPVDPYWDLWSLGVVAYEMLAGAHPFAGETSLDLHRAMLAGNFTPLSTHLPSAPARWQEFFVKSFSRDKHLRPASASAFFSALEDAFSQS